MTMMGKGEKPKIGKNKENPRLVVLPSIINDMENQLFFGIQEDQKEAGPSLNGERNWANVSKEKSREGHSEE